MAQQGQVMLTSPTNLSKELELFAKTVSDDTNISSKDIKDPFEGFGILSEDFGQQHEKCSKYAKMELEMKHKDKFIESNLNQIASLNEQIKNVQTQNGDIQKILNISSTFTGMAVDKYTAKMNEKNENIKILQAKLTELCQSEQAKTKRIEVLENQISESRATSAEFSKMAKDFNKKQLELTQAANENIEHLKVSKKRQKGYKKQCVLLTKNNKKLLRQIEAQTASFKWRQNMMTKEIELLKLEMNEKDETINGMREKHSLFEKEFVSKHQTNTDRIRSLKKKLNESNEKMIEYTLLQKKYNELNARNRELQEAETRGHELMREFGEIRQDNHEKSQTIKYLHGKIKGLKAESFELMTVNRESRRRIINHEEEIIELKKQNMANKKEIKEFDDRMRESMQSENAYIMKHEANVIQIKALNDEIRKLRESIEKNEMELSRQKCNEMEVIRLKGINEEMEAKLRKYEETSIEQMKEIDAAVEEKRDLQRQISGMQSDNQQKEEALRVGTEERNGLLQKYMKIKGINEQFYAVEQAQDDEVVILNEEIEKLRERIHQNEGGHKDEIAALDDEIRKINEHCSELNEQNEAMSLQINAFEEIKDKYKVVDETFHMLKSENCALRKEIEEVKVANNEIHEYKAEICLLRSQILQERENVDRFKYEKGKMTEFIEANKVKMSENEALKQQSLNFEQMHEQMIGEYAQNMSAMKNEYVALKEKIETLQFENAKETNQEHKEYIGKLQMALKRKVEEMAQMKMEFIATNERNLVIIRRLNEKNKQCKEEMHSKFESERIANDEALQRLNGKICELKRKNAVYQDKMNVTNKESDNLRQEHVALQNEHRSLVQKLKQFNDGCGQLENMYNQNMDRLRKKYMDKINELQTKIGKIQRKLPKFIDITKGEVENENDFMDDLRVNLMKFEKEFMAISPKNKSMSLSEQITNDRTCAYEEYNQALQQCVSQQNNCKKLLGQSEESDVYSFKREIAKIC